MDVIKLDCGRILLAAAVAFTLVAAGCSSAAAEKSGQADTGMPVSADSGSEWARLTAEKSNVQVRRTGEVGGRCDLLGDGALLLTKKDTEAAFCSSDEFRKNGSWTSQWMSPPDGRVGAVQARLLVYGQKQDMSGGWTKFAGNPLVCANGWKHATENSLQLPADISAQPQDQSLVRGTGELEGKWLLFFNIGAWAVKGWGMAVADDLSPLKDGTNPFSLYQRYPLYRGTGGHNAPNDWIYAEETWWAPDETKGEDSHMWSSDDLAWWTNEGVIRGMDGHDPGIVYDGKRYYLFNEKGHKIVLCTSKNPTGGWKKRGTVLEVGGHTGDADVSFFNNRWHMFFDENPHAHYRIGYAWTTPSEFPRGWRLTHRIYGPHRPEQEQKWDDDTEEGNQFGTGDADVALDGTTLYLTHERPVGVAWKELAVTETDEQQVRVRLQFDRDSDGTADASTDWHVVSGGENSWKPEVEAGGAEGRVRVQLRMATENPVESPLLTRLKVTF